ncbi:MAG: tetratricopeptide repeat protein [Thermoanaerobaculia bacterium]
MDEARWDRIQELFHQVVDLDEGARRAFLDASCAGDEDLRREVESLVASAPGATDFLGSPREPAATDGRDEGDRAGERVGPYRLTRRLGEGGMGVVYLGERADGEFTQQVAVKLLRTPWAAPHLLERFRAEREILAGLQHPNIARLLDGGTTPLGQPYLVMEHVAGEPLHDYCARRGLGTRERLVLFLGVCAAVAQAHRQLVVHRDLKPGNILVTADGTPKLLDFGIAKLLAPETAAAVVTALHGPGLTPEYASPEQVRGEPVTTASDVYSLGVLLYELLTGALPYRFATQTPGEVERVVCETPPTRPSTAVARGAQRVRVDAQGRALARTDVAPSRLRRELAGDLDTIVLTALRKEPERRYPSVERLAEDIRRYLDDLPITARPETWGYVTSKFAQRHRAGVAVAAGVAAMVLAFGVGMALLAVRLAEERSRAVAAEGAARDEAARANREAAAAQQVTEFLIDLFQVSDPGQARGATITAREILDRGAERVESELADQPLLQARLLDTMGTVYVQLGLYPSAEPLLDRVLALRERELGDSEEVAQSLDARAWVAFMQGRHARAVPLLARALRIRERLLGPEHPLVAESLNNLAAQHRELRHFQRAAALYRRAISIFRAHAEPGDARVAYPLSNLATVYHDQGRFEEAEPLHLEALAIRRRELEEDHPEVAMSLNNTGWFYYLSGDTARAEAYFLEALALRRKVLGAEHPNTALTLNNLGLLYLDAGRLGEAESYFQRALAIREKRLRPDHPNIADSLYGLGLAAARRGDPGRARPLLERALAIRLEARGPDHPETVATREALADLSGDSG